MWSWIAFVIVVIVLAAIVDFTAYSVFVDPDKRMIFLGVALLLWILMLLVVAAAYWVTK